MGYILASIIAILLGQVTKHLCLKLPPVVAEKITYKEYFKTFKDGFKIDIKYSSIFLVLFNLIIYTNGMQYLSYIYMIAIFSLAIVFSVDYRTQLIPDETHVIIVVVALINILMNLSNWSSYVLGAIVGGGIFYTLGIVALAIYKKEGMGFGDVKLMASLGLLFGLKNILVIALLSFAIGAVISILLIVLKKKKMDSYIPFGPFIVIGAILVIYIPADVYINGYFALCSWLGMVVTDMVFYFMK